MLKIIKNRPVNNSNFSPVEEAKPPKLDDRVIKRVWQPSVGPKVREEKEPQFGVDRSVEVYLDDFPRNCSFEMGDELLLHDPWLNSIPGTCFEIGTALALLNDPGEAGENMDAFARKLSEVLDKVYNSDFGNHKVLFAGREQALKEIFDSKLLREIRPQSDQIGRCLDETLQENWFEGDGFVWLQKELAISSSENAYTYKNMLTKIRMLSAFGTVVRELLSTPSQSQTVGELTSIDNEFIQNRYENIVTLLRHKDFDSPKTRARYERPPIIKGTSLVDLKLPLQDASELNIGFGKVYGPKGFENLKELSKEYEKEENSAGRQGLKRDGQPIADLKRPGNISEYGMKNMPVPFKQTQLLDLLEQNQFHHGTGVNRWQVNGTYSRQSWVNGLPSAGAHSGEQ